MLELNHLYAISPDPKRQFPWKSKIEVPFTDKIVKESMWKPLQKAVTGKESTTELTTGEVNEIYEVLSQYLADRFGIDVPFPSEESLSEEQR